jgi:hypothetical protein
MYIKECKWCEGLISVKKDSKIRDFPYEIEVIYKDRIKPYLNYVRSKYGNNFINLYE